VAGFVLESGSRDFSVRDFEVHSAMATHLGLVRTIREARGAAEPNGALEALTRREREVVDLAAAGLTNREIGASLFISPGTVRKHLDNVYAKLGVRNRAAAVAVVLGGDEPASPEVGRLASRGATRRGSSSVGAS
jgi:DNA-binding CsgD family transcriptional regulator